jgi:hypothetical protein
MTVLAELESQSKELSSAIENLVTHCQRAQLYADGTVPGKPPQIIPHEAPAEVHRARESVLASISRLQVMLAGPNDFLKQLASQVSRQFSLPPFSRPIIIPRCIQGTRPAS